MGRTYARVVDFLPAAGLQLRVHAAGSRQRHLGGHEEEWLLRKREIYGRKGADGGREHMKKNGYLRPQDGFIPIHMPKNTGAGFVIAALCAVLGFALIWHMWLPAAVAFVAVLAAVILHTFNYERDFHIPAEEVARVESARTRLMAAYV